MTEEIEQIDEFIKKSTYVGITNVLNNYKSSLLDKKLETDTKKDNMKTVEISQVEDTKLSPPIVISPKPKPIGNFISIEDFSWDQGSYNSQTITIYCDIEGVGEVKDNVSFTCTKSSFDLTVLDCQGKNYRLIKDNLEKDIVPSECKIIVKKNKVLIKLQKKKGEHLYETWQALIAKKKRDAASEAKKGNVNIIIFYLF